MSPEKKDTEKQFHESINVQGLAQVFDGSSNRIRRTMWLLILCGGIAFTAFNIYNQVTLYLSEPVSIRVDQILAKRLHFPSVTICNNNFLSKSAIAGAGIEPFIPMILPYLDFDEVLPETNSTQLTLNELIELVDTEDLLTSWIQMSHTKNETVLRCRWESRRCGVDNFTRVTTDENMCITFNVNGDLMAKSSGRANGLRLLLNVQEDQYVRSLEDYVSTGFMVTVHAADVPPVMSHVGIAVAPGNENFLGVKVMSQSAKEGISGCIVEANYSREACILECWGTFVIKLCGCRDVSIQQIAPLCSLMDFYMCYFPAEKEYMKSGTGCEESCFEPCSFTSFDIQYSNAPLSSIYLADYAKAKGQTKEYWRENLVVLEVYLTSMTYRHMEKRRSYEILDLFCDVGGALGLLLGASILTVLEIFDILFTKSMSRLVRKKGTQKVDIEQEDANDIQYI